MRTGSWQARVAQGLTPAERVEAELRYAFVAPLVRGAAVWVDLGCGDGVAAAAALGAERPGRVVVVDGEADALASARRQLDAEAVEADLATGEGTAAVRAALADAEGSCVVTCFEVLAQLDDITALVELLVASAERGAVVLSVASAAVAEELRRLLPPDARSFRLVPVRAAAIVGTEEAEAPPLGAVAIGEDAVPAGHLLAFGAGAERLAPASRAAAADLTAERADVRRRESDLAYLEARVAAVEAP